MGLLLLGAYSSGVQLRNTGIISPDAERFFGYGLSMRSALNVILVVLILTWSGGTECADMEPPPPAETLRRHGIEPNVESVLGFLRQWQPSAADDRRIGALVRQLGHEDYFAREEASRQLSRIGIAATGALRAAAESDDFEVSYRARRLLRTGGRDGELEQRQILLTAALRWLRQAQSSQATPVLLEILPVLPTVEARQEAAKTLWACVVPADTPRLEQAVGNTQLAVRVAAIPALELAAGERATNTLQVFLLDKDESVRLAAARALLDRRSNASIAALVGLLDSQDTDVHAQAAWLLQQLSGIPSEKDQGMDLTTAGIRWKAWAASPAADHPQPLGCKRLEVARYGLILLESFLADAEIRDQYHEMQYASNCGGKGSVSHGILRLDGNHGEGDQRLYVTSRRLLDQPTFPARFRIKTQLGAEADNAGVWHIGVSVGNIRILFHPGLEGGAFRAERLDNQQHLIENESMPFTPACNVRHPITIDVWQRDKDAVQLEVAVADGGKTGRPYRRTLAVRGEDIGPLGRVGLERSGQTGGAALFGPLTIEHGQGSTQ
jgi:hypothetical protein